MSDSWRKTTKRPASHQWFVQASTGSERHHTVTTWLLRHNTVVFSTWTRCWVSHTGLFWKQHGNEGAPSGWRRQRWTDGSHLGIRASEEFIRKYFVITSCVNSCMIPDVPYNQGDSELFSTVQLLRRKLHICKKVFYPWNCLLKRTSINNLSRSLSINQCYRLNIWFD